MAEKHYGEKAVGLQHTALAITRWIGSPASIVIHSIVFVICFSSVLLNVIQFDTLLLVLNTIISLEAIYLALFNQLAINYANEGIQAVSKDIDEIQEDIDEIQEDVDEMQEDVEEIQENIDEVQEDVEEIQEDVEEMSEEESGDEAEYKKDQRTLEQLHEGLQKLIKDVERLQTNYKLSSNVHI